MGKDDLQRLGLVGQSRDRSNVAVCGAVRATGPSRMSEAEIEAIVAKLADIARVLQDADPEDKGEIFRQLGLKLTYHPGRRLVQATVQPAGYWFSMVSEGRAHPKKPIWRRTSDQRACGLTVPSRRSSPATDKVVHRLPERTPGEEARDRRGRRSSLVRYPVGHLSRPVPAVG